jgi:hypothetical protein
LGRATICDFADFPTGPAKDLLTLRPHLGWRSLLAVLAGFSLGKFCCSSSYFLKDSHAFPAFSPQRRCVDFGGRSFIVRAGAKSAKLDSHACVANQARQNRGGISPRIVT